MDETIVLGKKPRSVELHYIKSCNISFEKCLRHISNIILKTQKDIDKWGGGKELRFRIRSILYLRVLPPSWTWSCRYLGCTSPWHLEGASSWHFLTQHDQTNCTLIVQTCDINAFSATPMCNRPILHGHLVLPRDRQLNHNKVIFAFGAAEVHVNQC